MNESSRLAQDRLARQRSLVLDWIRAPHCDPQFLANTPPSDLRRFHDTIAQRFLEHVQAAGFRCQVAEILQDGQPAYEGHWTHCGSNFVGFKQPPPESNPADALLAGCAALLENEWCRARLPQ